MIENLRLANFPAQANVFIPNVGQSFVMKTCQRTLILSMNQLPSLNINNEDIDGIYHEGTRAYSYLLEIILGIKSKMLGENEIVNQFRDAYKAYLKQEERNSFLITILEKMLKDAKNIRSTHLMGIGQKTYAGITRKLLLNKGAKEVLIVGSGNLAIDAINQLKKKVDRLIVCARNKEKAQALADEHGVEILPWEEVRNSHNFSFIVNTIGVEGLILFNQDYFKAWSQKGSLFIDLGHPSVLDTDLAKDEGVIRLKDIFEEGAIREQEKMKKVENAKAAIKTITIDRMHSFSLSFPFGWEDLSFV